MIVLFCWLVGIAVVSYIISFGIMTASRDSAGGPVFAFIAGVSGFLAHGLFWILIAKAVIKYLNT
jgi:hypothetical protein